MILECLTDEEWSVCASFVLSAGGLVGRPPRDRRTVQEVPTKGSCDVQKSVSHALSALRSGIACFITCTKNSRRVATRYDQTADSVLAFAALASITLWIRAGHAASASRHNSEALSRGKRASLITVYLVKLQDLSPNMPTHQFQLM